MASATGEDVGGAVAEGTGVGFFCDFDAGGFGFFFAAGFLTGAVVVVDFGAVVVVVRFGLVVVDFGAVVVVVRFGLVVVVVDLEVVGGVDFAVVGGEVVWVVVDVVDDDVDDEEVDDDGGTQGSVVDGLDVLVVVDPPWSGTVHVPESALDICAAPASGASTASTPAAAVVRPSVALSDNTAVRVRLDTI